MLQKIYFFEKKKEMSFLFLVEKNVKKNKFFFWNKNEKTKKTIPNGFQVTL